MVEKEATDNSEEEKTEVSADPLGELRTEFQTFKGEMEDKLKGEQRISSKKELDNQRLRGQLNKRDGDTDLSKALLGILADQRNQPVDEFEETVRKNQPDLVKQYDEITQRSAEKKSQEEYAVKADDVWTRAKNLGLPDDHDVLLDIYDYLADGKIHRAETKLRKLEVAKEVKPTETKEPTYEEGLEEGKRKAMEESNQLMSDTGKSSAGSGEVLTAKQVEDMPYKEFEKRFPNMGAFTEALTKGEIRK